MDGQGAIPEPAEPCALSCPRCGQPGRPVSAVTLASVLRPEMRRRLSSLAGYRFCATLACEVAYFHPASGDRVACAELCVPIFQKSANPDRLVCYCFRHTVAAIQKEVRETGTSRIAADIKARCVQGLDDCEHTNPQVCCCLGNVQRVIREATGDSQPPPADSGVCCGH